MSRSTKVYIGMTLALGLGLWGIFVAGGFLSAPRDLSGTWELESGQERLGKWMRIDQSGRFYHLEFERGPKLDLRRKSEHTEAGDSGAIAIDLVGGAWTASLAHSPADESIQAKLVENGTIHPFSAHRISSDVGASQGTAQAHRPRSGEQVVILLLLQLAVVLAASRVLGILFTRMHQPQVMGEMIAGILLGPSFLGWLSPAVSAAVFPPDTIGNINILSQVGVIFFLFLIGLELDPQLIRNRGQAAIVISHVSIFAPFLLGAALSLLMYVLVFNSQMRFLAVALFMGASMSITAFPVLARILTERNLHKTPVGAVAITCAAVDDVTAWCILAFVVAVARASGVQPAMMTAGKSLVYVLVMFLLVRPFLRRLQRVFERQGRIGQHIVAIIILLVLVSAFTTAQIGIHALFGAFLMGAIMPKGTAFVRALSEKMEDFTVVFLLPLFFAFTGLKTQIGLLNNPILLLLTALVILVACLGKFGGSALAARSSGMSWRLGGDRHAHEHARLMELVILNIGRELGVITSAVFAMMVLMAIVTTAMTTPMLHLIYPKRLLEQQAAAAGARRGFSILIPVASPTSGVSLLRLAALLIGKISEESQLIALHLRRPTDREAYRSGLPEPPAGPDEALAPLLAHAKQHSIAVEPLSQDSRDVAADIARFTRARPIDLVMIGFHRPVFSRAILGGTVHRVLTGADANVAVFVDRGLENLRTILVPFMRGPHDRLALQVARRLARNSQAKLTVLQVGAGRPRAEN